MAKGQPPANAFKKGNKLAPGGKRTGSGRYRGVVNRKTAEIAARAFAEGLTPLDIMLLAMREQWALYAQDKSPERAMAAVEAARHAAPYMHAKLAAVEHSAPDGGPVQFEIIERVIVDPAAH